MKYFIFMVLMALAYSVSAKDSSIYKSSDSSSSSDSAIIINDSSSSDLSSSKTYIINTEGRSNWTEINPSTGEPF